MSAVYRLSYFGICQKIELFTTGNCAVLLVMKSFYIIRAVISLQLLFLHPTSVDNVIERVSHKYHLDIGILILCLAE